MGVAMRTLALLAFAPTATALVTCSGKKTVDGKEVKYCTVGDCLSTAGRLECSAAKKDSYTPTELEMKDKSICCKAKKVSFTKTECEAGLKKAWGKTTCPHGTVMATKFPVSDITSCCTDDESSCFPAEATAVQGGLPTRVSDLQVGASVLTEASYEPVIGFGPVVTAAATSSAT